MSGWVGKSGMGRAADSNHSGLSADKHGYSGKRLKSMLKGGGLTRHVKKGVCHWTRSLSSIRR
jgi:hypothetical protein